MHTALEHKSKGNQFFTQKDWENAISEFSKAIELDPSNHIFYSNRSACYLEQKNFSAALADADKCIDLNTDWAKGYARKANVLFLQNDFKSALEFYQKALELDPENPSHKDNISLCNSKLETPNYFGNMFNTMFSSLNTHPKFSAYLQDPSFVSSFQQIQSNPQSITQYMQDPRIMEVFSFLLQSVGVNMPDPSTFNSNTPAEEKRENSSTEKSKESQSKKEEKSGEEKEAEEEKAKGNSAYKEKKFDEAIEHYTRAHSLFPKNISSLTNRAAVHMMKKDFEKAREDCLEAIKVGRKLFSSFESIAKAFARLGDIAMKEEKYDEAIKRFKESLLEKNEYVIKKKLKEAERLRKEKEEREYFDSDKALEHKEKGNALFKESKWEDALREYSESIKRNPSDYKVYCNRAAVYSKLMAWEPAINDCDHCINLDPSFTKSYLRKGKIQHLLKDYYKAVLTFNKGLQYEPNSTQILEAKQSTLSEVMMQSREGKFSKEKQSEAMKDPEIQAILKDEQVREALEKMKTSSVGMSSLLGNPLIMRQIEVLMAAGVVQLGA